MIWNFFRKNLLPKNFLTLIEPQALDIIKRLQHGGASAYLVGGCVRDLLIGIAPKDFDMATAANPYRVKSLIDRSQIIGKRFRIVIARRRRSLSGHKNTLFPPLDKNKFMQEFQITTFRRAPEKTLSGALNENVFGNERDDAERRDFTLNGLFLDPFKARIVDYVGGTTDIQNKRIRTIGDPFVRFEEDPIRMLRALRFEIRMNFHLEKKTAKALHAKAKCLQNAKKERVREEFLKMARDASLATFLKKCIHYDLLTQVSPTLHRHFEGAEGKRHLIEIEKLDKVLKTIPWPNQHLAAPYFFFLLVDGTSEDHLRVRRHLFSLREDLLISKAEWATMENCEHMLERALRSKTPRLFWITRRNFETQAQFFFIIKVLADLGISPIEKIWSANQDLWRDLKQKNFYGH